MLILKGVARPEEEHATLLHAARVRVPVPSVIRLLEYRRIPHQTRALSRKNILLRDRNTCQYCATILPASELTLDHVVPRSRGGLSTWENLVACCHTCNRTKGNQMIHELEDMRLMREPRPFSLHTSRHIMRMIGSSDFAGENICTIERDGEEDFADGNRILWGPCGRSSLQPRRSFLSGHLILTLRAASRLRQGVSTSFP